MSLERITSMPEYAGSLRYTWHVLQDGSLSAQLEQCAGEGRVCAQAGACAGHLLLGEPAVGPLAPPLDEPGVVAHDLGQPLAQQCAVPKQAAVAPPGGARVGPQSRQIAPQPQGPPN